MPNIVNVTTIVDSRLTNVRLIFIGGISVFSQGSSSTNLKALEEKIAYARQFYNDVVQKYNTKIEVVPTNIIAGLFHFEQAAYFQVDEADRQAPQVKF